MKRYVDLEEITDGKRYKEDDLAKLPCNGCAGCSSCCHDVENTIILDPFDAWQLTANLECSFADLLNKGIVELRTVDGMILPNLRILPKGGCVFLNEMGRCIIHDFRPGFCRLFPLGRLYEDGRFSYILQVHECSSPQKAKTRIRDWISIPESNKYNEFVLSWHNYCKNIQSSLEGKSDQEAKDICMGVLQKFFLTDYNDFYAEIKERLEG